MTERKGGLDGDRRLIEDYLPIEVISEEAAREKSVRKGHIQTLHLWWARRPLVAARAAVYGALVPASRFVPPNGSETKAKSLGRANAAKFLERLCKYPGNPAVLAEAEEHILAAHAERLMAESGKPVSIKDIRADRAARPIVLDMFAGGGAIPLEALRLGCEAYAVDLNPVAHIVELCTLVYPEKYGKADTSVSGSAKDNTWAGLAEEMRYWGEWVLDNVRKEVGDLYPLIPDPKFKGRRPAVQHDLWVKSKEEVPHGYLVPIAYLWTRTVRCKSTSCGRTVPLLKQSWLCKKEKRFVAVKTTAPKKASSVRFEIVESSSERGLGFDPDAGSRGGNATCPFCGTVSDNEYVKSEGRAGRLGDQLVAVVAGTEGSRGWVYLAPDDVPGDIVGSRVKERLDDFLLKTQLSLPNESIAGLASNSYENSLGITVRPYGLTRFADLFSKRQLLFHLVTAHWVREVRSALQDRNYSHEHALAVQTLLACVVDRATDFGCKLCVWNPYKDSGTTHAFGRQTITMVWDFSEVNPFNTDNASWLLGLNRIASSLADAPVGRSAKVARGSATRLPFGDCSVHAVICDPPYYDNVPYADISDFFYVWLKRTIGHAYPEHFANELTPKKQEAIADAARHDGDRESAKRAYEELMASSFREAHRVLKPGGQLVVVYAHKTTLGWATLVDALRTSGFTVTEAWPLDTEKPGRLRAQGSAALASSIFLVGRKRDGQGVGSYEDVVRPDLEQIVRERVESLWDLGIAGADLVIAGVGAGLRAFTRFGRVEYANGESVPTERFLGEVEGMVLETLLEKIFGVPRPGVAAVDGPSRFYVLWRYTYGAAELGAGEAIVFTYGQGVELDGPKGLSSARRPLVEKKKGKYTLLDFTKRGNDERLGLPSEDGTPASQIDVLHRMLWLLENEPRKLSAFLDEGRPDRERLKLCAQALAGASLKGKTDQEAKTLVTTTTSEQAALGKLTANWRALVEQRIGDYDAGGQKRLAYARGDKSS